MSKLVANINPKILSWARESAGFSVEEVVNKINQEKITFEVIKAWEEGTAKPSYPQFEKLAEYYKRPLALFYLPKPPEEKTLEEKFRSLPIQYIKKLPPKIRFIVRKARIRQLDLMELHNEMPPEETKKLKELKQIVQYNQADVKQIARSVREFLGISLEKQKGWQDEDLALKKWRSRLEDLGLWIFKDAFRKQAQEYDGFYLTDDYFPIIYINNSKSKHRQIFTLFHELGHFLLSKGGICFRDDLELKLSGSFQKDEVFCNAFAGEFLVPEDDFSPTRMPDDEEIKNYAKEYKVSKEVILRKCKEKGLIDWDEYNRRKRNWAKTFNLTKTSYGESKGGGDYYLNQRAYLGNKYLELVFSQYDQKNISEFQLADYLGVNVNSLSKLKAVMYQGESQ